MTILIYTIIRVVLRTNKALCRSADQQGADNKGAVGIEVDFEQQVLR